VWQAPHKLFATTRAGKDDPSRRDCARIARGRVARLRICAIDDEADRSGVRRRLMTIPGVGKMTALASVTAIDDPHHLATHFWPKDPKGRHDGSLSMSFGITRQMPDMRIANGGSALPGTGPAVSSPCIAYVGFTPPWTLPYAVSINADIVRSPEKETENVGLANKAIRFA